MAQRLKTIEDAEKTQAYLIDVACSGIGLLSGEGDDDVFLAGSEASACLKDLQRYLRRDDKRERKAYTLLAKRRVVGELLLPLLKAYGEDTRLKCRRGASSHCWRTGCRR